MVNILRFLGNSICFLLNLKDKNRYSCTVTIWWGEMYTIDFWDSLSELPNDVPVYAKTISFTKFKHIGGT